MAMKMMFISVTQRQTCCKAGFFPPVSVAAWLAEVRV